MADVMELYSWSGDFGLPSIDIHCLEVLSYAKFAGCPLKVNRCNKPWKSPTWEFPVLKSGEDVLTSSHKIMDHLRRKNFNADYQLTAKQGADTLAFIALIEDKLLPAMQYTLWVDSKNYVEFTRPLYAKKLPLPFNFFVPGSIANKMKFMATHGLDTEEGQAEDDSQENKVLKEALECLTHLSVLLGDKEFFFGESPTTLDAVVFAHLAVVWRAPSLPNNKLVGYLKGYDNLYSFCGRILQRYFPPDPEDPQPKPSPTHSSLDDDPNQRRKMWLSAAAAAVAMAAYALLSGLVQIEFKEDNRDGLDAEDSLPDASSFQYQDSNEEE